MSHISTLGAGVFSDLSMTLNGTGATLAAVTIPASVTQTTLQAMFSTAEVAATAQTGAAATAFTRIQNVREFPSIGIPANIVNVATYGSKNSRQVNGQPDAPTIEITVNYIPADWAPGGYLGNALADGLLKCFRFTLLNGVPSNYLSIATTGIGTGPRENSQWFWYGKLEALLINPQLTDANTATLTISVQSDFYGPYTN